MELKRTKRAGKNLQRYLITGVVTVIPLWITWWVFNFLLKELSAWGRPMVRAASRLLQPYTPTTAELLLNRQVQFVIAALLMLCALYLLGWLATKVIGKRLIALVDTIMHRIPLVERIYGSTRKLVNALGEQPESVQRVVLIPFPTPEMRAVGFVTKTFNDANNGRLLAAVYVPTTPNPTSGYIEIIPIEHVISTNWTVDEAMSFIISGGTICPPNLSFDNEMRPIQQPHDAKQTSRSDSKDPSSEPGIADRKQE